MIRKVLAVGAAGAALLLAGCHTDMWVQNKVHKPLQESDFFPDRMASRDPVPDTVAREELRLDPALTTGIKGGTRVNVEITSGSPVQTGIFRGEYVSEFPFPIEKKDVERGRELFDTFCSPCHGRLGDGNGMIALRGFNLRRKPADYHTDRLRRMPVGHFFDVITNGYGIMYGYASRIGVEDRWRVVAYVRALQRSQYTPTTELSPEDLARLEKASRMTPQEGQPHE